MSASYEDMIHLPHHVSKIHPPMALADRAAQFSPFSALTGYGEAIDETVRDTSEQQLLSEDEQAQLNDRLIKLQQRLHTCPTIQVTYFIPDAKKAGGAYRSTMLQLKKIDVYHQQLVGTKGEKISLKNVQALQEIPEGNENAPL